MRRCLWRLYLRKCCLRRLRQSVAFLFHVRRQLAKTCWRIKPTFIPLIFTVGESIRSWRVCTPKEWESRSQRWKVQYHRTKRAGCQVGWRTLPSSKPTTKCSITIRVGGCNRVMVHRHRASSRCTFRLLLGELFSARHI